MKMIRRTSTMSTKGVTLMSDFSPWPPICIATLSASSLFLARNLLGDQRDLAEPRLVGLDHHLADVAVLHRPVRLDQHRLLRHSIVHFLHLGDVLVPGDRLLLDVDDLRPLE